MFREIDQLATTDSDAKNGTDDTKQVQTRDIVHPDSLPTESLTGNFEVIIQLISFLYYSKWTSRTRNAKADCIIR